MIYTLVKKLIALGQTDGLADKVDVYYLAGRLTKEQYVELMNILRPVDPEPDPEPEAESEEA